MPQTSWTARRKLATSLVVLAAVLAVAVIAQLAGFPRRENPYAAPSSEAAKAQPPRERAVFGGEPRPQPATEESTRSRAEEPSRSAGVDEFLERWTETVRSGDLEAHIQLYAPKLDRFFRQRNVTIAEVRKDKTRMMKTYPKVRKYEISDVRVEKASDDETVVSFRKDWDMAGRRRFAGAERQRLKLRRVDGTWKIASEEETKVYRVTRG